MSWGGKRLLDPGLLRAEELRVRPGENVVHRLQRGQHLSAIAETGGDLVYAGTVVSDTPGVDAGPPAERDGSGQMELLADHGRPVDAEDLFGAYAGVPGVEARVVDHDLLRGHPVRDEVVAHHGGLVIVLPAVVAADQDD